MTRLSVVMPVRNEATYIEEAIGSLQRQAFSDWELIVVDDHSTDATTAIVSRKRARDSRIRMVPNRGWGQVQALNTGYAESEAPYIKFMDGDDVLSPRFSALAETLCRSDASYHDIEIVRSDLKSINILRLSSKFKDAPFVSCFRAGVVHPSRSAWTFSRRVGARLFPLPARLPSPHEDYWIAVSIKRHAAGLDYVPAPLYRYRQHGDQTFRGIYNFSPDVVSFRARAMLGIIDVMESEEEFGLGHPEIGRRLAAMRTYYGILALESAGVIEILGADLSLGERAKLLVVKKFPSAAARLSRFKSGLTSRHAGAWK